MAHRWKVFTVVSLGVFMVEPRPVHRQHRVPRHPARLHRHEPRRRSPGSSTPTRSCSRRCSSPPAARRPRSAASAAFLGGLAAFTARLRAVRRRPLGERARGRARPPGGGRRLHAPDLARRCCSPSSRPSSRATAVGALGRRGRRRGGRRPAHRRTARRGRAGAGCSWSTCRSASARCGRRADAARGPRARRAPRGPTWPARSCSRAAIGLLALGIVQGRDWGWGSPEIVGVVRRRGAAHRGVRRWRSAHHPAPVIEPAMLRVRSFAVANLGALLFFAAFGGDAARRRPVPHRASGATPCSSAGLELAPGPGDGRGLRRSGRAARDRFGQRAVGAPGRAALFAPAASGGSGRWAPTPPTPPTSCPGCSSAGAGVGLSIPTLSSAAAASLPPERFATGTAVFDMSRQIGMALGVAVLVAILAGASAPNPMDAFDARVDVHAHRHVRRRRRRRGARRVRVGVPRRPSRAPAEARA